MSPGRRPTFRAAIAPAACFSLSRREIYAQGVKPVREDAALIRRLQTLRNVPSKELSVRAEFGALTKTIKRQARNVGGLGGALCEMLPPELAPHLEVVSMARGVLTVRAADASVKFQVDRWLRSGGEQELMRRAGVALVRVRLVM